MGEIIIGNETTIEQIQVSSIRYGSTQDLIEKMKRIPLMGKNVQVYPYRDSTFEIVRLDPKTLFPAQYYVLEQELKKIRFLRKEFISQGIDVFELRGALNFTCDGKHISMYPPVVEISQADGGIQLICDGVHRIYSALSLGSCINVLRIDNIHPGYPYYAVPNKNGWNDVKLSREVPDDKKDYRVLKPGFVPRDHYRNFNAEFPASTGFRINVASTNR